MNGVVERCEKTVAGRAVIPEGVTRIGEAAFKDCIGLQWVRIPSTVTEIGSSAFKECTALTTFTLPNSLTRIDRQAFTHCNSLASVVIPGQVQEIGEQAFYCCESLTTVVIHPGVTKIGEEAFARCTSLVSVVIPDTVTEIAGRAFCGCTKLAQVTIPASVERIGPLAFKNCNIIQLDHPCLRIENGLALSSGAVEYCAAQLSKAVIPQGVTKIGARAFYRCETLVEVDIPDTVTEIADCAFNYCPSLAQLALPLGITRIGERTFAGCRSLSQVSIPDSVTEIADFAFGSCDIKELSHPCLQIRNGIACSEKTVRYCVQERPTIVIPEGMTEIGEAAFVPRNRRRKFRGEDVRNYAYNEYIDWEGEYRVEADFDFVTQVIIAQSITHIHSKAFEDLDNLESIVFPDTYPFCVYDSFDLGIVWEENFDYETQEYLYKLPNDRWMR